MASGWGRCSLLQRFARPTPFLPAATPSAPRQPANSTTAPCNPTVSRHRSRVTAPIFSGRSLLRSTEKSGGMLTVSNTLTVTVDGDPPVSTLKGLVDRQYVLGSKSTPRTLVIGGDASDPTSGIARVFVTVNQTSGGTPKLATGTSTWAYPLQVTEGAYRIQVAAVDNADIGQPSTTQPDLVFADGAE